jgi:hypothetical protein
LGYTTIFEYYSGLHRSTKIEDHCSWVHKWWAHTTNTTIADVTSFTTLAMEFEHGLHVQAEFIVAVVSAKFSHVWTTLWKVVPKLSEDITPIAPLQCIEIVVYAWSCLVARTDNLEQELFSIKLEE